MSTLTTSVDPNTNAIVDKKIARGEIDATSTESSSSSSESAPIIKPDVPGFLKQFIVSDVIVNILIAITLFGSIGVYLSHVAQSNCMPGLEINVSTESQSSIMNLFRKWGWSFQPEQTYGQTANFEKFNTDNALYRLFAPKDNSTTTTGIQPYLYEILKYLSEVNNLCTNTIFGGMYHLPQWLTMLIFIPVALMVFLFLLLVNSIFHIVGIVKFLTTALFDVDKETLSETIGHACYALFHLVVLTWIIPWITTFAAFVEPMRTEFKWNCNDPKSTTTKTKKFQDFFNVFIRVMQPFILILISLSMVSNANTYLGDGFTGASIFAILFFVYRGWYHVDISTFPEVNTFFKL